MHTDVLIIGGGMVGLSLAHQLISRNTELNITIVDKESQLGLHSSGRNSGVLHAGIYYPPDSLKARVCVSGARRLRTWCEEEGLPVLPCGKVIVTQETDQDYQLEILLARGLANGAEVHLISSDEISQIAPHAYSATRRGLWSPRTCVVQPQLVVGRLAQRLRELGVIFRLGATISKIDPSSKSIVISNSPEEQTIQYGYLYNVSGLQADRVAHRFHICDDLILLPFKGLYWQLSPECPLKFTTNVYPVPDLNLPFLGVHVTPSPDGTTYLGPTAIPAFGRENYNGFKGVEPFMTSRMLYELSLQWMKDSNGFRQYAREQGLQGFKPFFLRAARALIPSLRSEHLLPSGKIGIRPQLYNKRNSTIVHDFTIEHSESSTHVLNAISPAFTASFALADLIIDQTPISLS